MRNRSPKTRKLYDNNREARELYLCEHPVCVACGQFATCVDEILRGKNRLRAFESRACWLPACVLCNTGPLADAAEWPIAKKLAAKLLVDPAYFNLAAIWEINAPKGHPNPPQFVTADDVLAALQDLLIERGN